MSKKSNLKKLCKKLSNLKGEAVFSLVLPDEPLAPSHLLEVKNKLSDKVFEKISVIIHSGGGDINIAYQSAELLRKHCKKMTVIVPLYAKSAVTLLSLAADEIQMTELSELGPLDPQISERHRGGRRFTSALNPFKSLEQLQSFSLKTLDLAVKLILQQADITVEEAIEHAIKFTSAVSSPMYANLDIEKLGEYSRALSVGQEYGERLLRRYSTLKKSNQTSVLDKLVWGYPSHGYIIDIKELTELGFNVKEIQGEEKKIVYLIIKTLVSLKQTEIFCVEGDKKLKKVNRKK